MSQVWMYSPTQGAKLFNSPSDIPEDGNWQDTPCEAPPKPSVSSKGSISDESAAMKAELEAIKAAMAEEREETQRIIDERDLAEEAVKLLKEELTKAKKALKELQDEAGAAADAADAADGEDD